MTKKRKSPIGRTISTERARELSAMRRTFGAGTGAPRGDRPRCACGAMTLRRALTRGHDCGSGREPNLAREEI